MYIYITYSLFVLSLAQEVLWSSVVNYGFIFMLYNDVSVVYKYARDVYMEKANFCWLKLISLRHNYR